MKGASPHRALHVANGTSTSRTIEAAGIPGRVSQWADPLYEGPVPGGLTDAQLLEVRARHLGATANVSQQDVENELLRWRAAIERHDAFDELILWFEHDLFDQLNLIQLLTWIRARVPRAKDVSLICVGSFPGRPAFKGLGELAPHELASLFTARQPVSEAQYRLSERAWSAFREPTPRALDELRREDTTALPHLGPAITRLMQEYPWTADGLSRTERRLLQLADERKTDFGAVFPAMHDGETHYYVTDDSLVALAQSLSRVVPPLLEMAGAAGAVDTLRPTITLTDAGRAVLRGEDDRVATFGIDRWLGGVHLQGRAVWRWDESRQGIIFA